MGKKYASHGKSNQMYLKGKNIIWYLSIILSFFAFNDLKAQVANYSFTESSGTYAAITGTNAHASGWDDAVTSNTIPLGFTFNFNSTNYTTCSVNTNGFITFGTTISANNEYTPISSATGYAGAISAVGINMQDDNTRSIVYTTTGSAPNRIFIVQWTQTRRNARSGQFDFQIRLNETTNRINIIYGSCAPTGNNAQALGVQVGLRGSANTDFNNRSLTTNGVLWDGNTTAGTTNSNTCRTRSSNFPNSGLTFTWTPPAACTTPTAQPTALSLTPATTSVTGSFTAASPAPNNYLVVYNTTGVTPTPTNGTTYTIGAAIAGGTVADIDSNTAFSITGLTLGVTYYVYVFSYNSLCIGGPLYFATSPLNGSTTTVITYCTPTGNLDCSFADYISNVKINTLDNASNCSAGGYTNYAATGAQTTSLMKGVPYNFTLSVGPGTGAHSAAVFFDFNQDGDFVDANEYFLVSNAIAASTNTTISILIPAVANSGSVRMRVRYAYNFAVGSTNSCTMTDFYGEVEDYTVTIIPGVACTTPTQPTALLLSPTGTFISGSFTAASPAPNNYLVVYSTSNIAPAPVTGTTYTAGGTVGAGYTVASANSNTSFTITGLTNTTTYYVYIFSYNSICTGGPLYNLVSPLTGFTTTNTLNYCTPSVTAGLETSNYINQVNFIGNITNSNNSSTYSSFPAGFQDFSGLGTRGSQAQGEGLNIYVNTTGGANYMKAWVDWNKDGLFDVTTEVVYQCSNGFINTTFGFQIPIATTPGNYRLRLRISSISNTFTSCLNLAETGETEDYLFAVVSTCNAKISTITPASRCGTGTVTLGATGTAGTTQYRWYDAEIGGSLLGTTAATTWTTPSLVTTTTYYVTAFDGTCESLYRTAVKATVRSIPSLTLSTTNPVICGDNTIMDVQASGSNEQVFLIDENFESGLGTFTNNNIASVDAAKSNWQVQTSPYVPAYPTFPVWYPAISSGFSGNKFAMSTSDIAGSTTFGRIENALESAVVNTTTFVNLTLTFDMYFSSYLDLNSATAEFVVVEVRNGAGAWTAVPSGQYLSDVGIGTQFVSQSINMNAYVGITSLQVRIRYKAGWNDGVAVDDIKLFGDRPLSPFFTYSAGVNAFTDAAATIPYTGSPATIVYLKPTLAQLTQATFTIVATANLTNGCTTSGNINVTNNTKVWQGITSDWNTSSNWLPLGVPSSSNCVIVPDVSVISGSSYNAYAKTLKVKSAGDLEIQSNNNLTVTDDVTVETGGILTVKNNASLVQINNATNSGNIKMERTANMRETDYVYWSSPVASFASSAISPTTPTGYIYKWIPTIAANTNGWGNWTGGSETMTIGQGYIVRGPSNFTTTFQNYTATFTGVPNNGTITIGIQRGTYDGANYNTGVSSTLATRNDDNWNLLGNPYPSAINPTSFLAANTNLAGFVKIWSHGTAPSGATANPFYNTNGYNYSLSDYVTYNGSGSTAGPGVNNIAAGQGFFTLMNHTSAAASETVTFNNAMRRDGSGNVYSNNQFYRNAQSGPAEASRIWIDLITPSNTSSRALVGYVDGATNENDRLYDAFSDPKYISSFYSLLNNVPLEIQGKALPFDANDTVPMGFKTTANGSHTIAIATTDGQFQTDQTSIYLEDSYLNVIHNLKSAPYTFTTNTGTYNDRFILRYAQNALGNNNYDYNNDVKIFTNDNINIASSSLAIKKVVVHDVLGKVILERQNISKNEITLNDLKPTSNVLIVKVTLDTDVVVTKKVIY
jgi:GEVED domain/Ig-like domain CHU_C associated